MIPSDLDTARLYPTRTSVSVIRGFFSQNVGAPNYFVCLSPCRRCIGNKYVQGYKDTNKVITFIEYTVHNSRNPKKIVSFFIS